MKAFALVVLMACGPSTKAKAADALYSEQLHACVDNAATRAEADACIKDINAKWDDAGAPPASKDGGQ